MKSSMSIEQILRNSTKKPAKANMSVSGNVTVDRRDRQRFANGQRVRVLRTTDIPVVNGLTGENLGMRKRVIGTGTIRIDGRKTYVELDNPDLVPSVVRSPHCVQRNLVLSSGPRATKYKRNAERTKLYVQEIHE